MQKKLIIPLCVVSVSLQAYADVKPSALFSDNMVLQRETTAPVWGTADAGEKVEVQASWGAKASGKAGADGKWMLKLDTPKAGGPHTVTIKGKNTIELKNVLTGEVWFCSGQSNMDFYLKQLSKANPGRTAPEDAATAEYINKEMTTAKDAELRQFEVKKNPQPLGPVDGLSGQWLESDPTANPDFSATAYFFGRKLRQELKVPVGLIKCAWGGTRVEPWMPAERFKEDPEMLAYFEGNMKGLKQRADSWDDVKQKEKFQAAMEKWQKSKKGRKPRMAEHPSMNKQAPSTLFNGMVYPVIPFAIKGAIWYQGESNANHNTEKYEANFRRMISGWRQQWGQGEFPFYFAQLASFRNLANEPVDYDGWVSVCDQQRRTLGLKNTGMAVLNDIGEAKDIHPHNKVEVGERLALWALKKDYGKAGLVHSGPLYKSYKTQGSSVVIEFDSVGSGLMVAEKSGLKPAKASDAELKHFQICGADGQWKWANAKITGKNAVTVSHPEVKSPTVVRYAWASNASTANLYNKEGLPASLFTTKLEVQKPQK